MQRVNDILKTATTKITEPPLKNECLACSTKDRLYRVRVESVNQEEQKANVKLIDFDRDVNISFSDLYKLPPELYSIPPQARPVKQAALKYNEVNEEQLKKDNDQIWNIVNNAALYMQLVSKDENGPYVVLLDKPQIQGSGILGTILLQNNMATYVDTEYPPELQYVFDILKSIKPPQ